MSVADPPKKRGKPKPAAAGRVRAAVSEGGSVASQMRQDAEEAKPVPVVLRIPQKVLEQINGMVKRRRVRVPRHTWLLEAIVEKLDRENAESN